MGGIVMTAIGIQSFNAIRRASVLNFMIRCIASIYRFHGDLVIYISAIHSFASILP